MKKIIYLLLTLSLAVFSCIDDASVRVMSEFNCKDTKVVLTKEAGASFTSLILSNVGPVTAQFEADWLSVDVNSKRIIYTALTQNEGEDARVAIVRLSSGEYTVSVTVRQESKEPDLSLKIGQSVDEGIGMIYWVDPTDPMIGKAVSVKRLGGRAFEVSESYHNATSVVNGYYNSSLFTSASEQDAVAYCQSLGEGWYLPARDELWDLFDVYNGVGHNEPTFVSAVPDKLTEVEKAARTAFDAMLVALQGDGLNAAAGSGNGDSYWSSTESDANKAYWVRFGKSGADAGAKNSTARFVRCVRTIGNYTYPEEPATLTVTPNTVTLEGATASEATVAIASNKSAFTVTLADDSWLSATISGTNLLFKAKSRNSTGSVRTTTATVTAGTGAMSKSVEVIVNQNSAAGSSSLELSATAVTLSPDAMGKSEVITITSDETEFAVSITDNSWVQARVNPTNKTIYFCALSPRLSGGNRTTTATVTAGSGAGAATQQVTITQRVLLSTEFAVGQVIADNGALQGGIVFWVDPANRSQAKIMSLDRTSLAWSTAATPTASGVSLSGDVGLTNTQALAALPNASEMPALKYCMDKGTGWYWSARNDLEQIQETYNGSVISEITADVPNNITDYEKACRSAWDKLVTDAGGTIMNTGGPSENGDSYWTCRESSSGSNGFYVRFGKIISWSSGNATKTGAKYIRAIRMVSK